MERNKVHLGDVCKVVSGSTPKTGIPEYWNGDIKWITPAEIQEDSFYIYDSVRHITLLGKEKTGLSYMPKGTVILSSRAPIGKTAITGCEMCCNQGFKNLICSDKIFNEYLYYFLKGKEKYLNSLGRGATFKEISKKIVEDIEIPLPNIKEQKHIATVLGCIDRVISLRQQQLAKLDELVKARFVEMFSDTRAEEPLATLCTFIDYRGKTPEKAERGLPFITAKNIKMHHMSFETKEFISKETYDKVMTRGFPKVGDVVFTTEAPLGNVCRIPYMKTEFYIGQRIITMQTKALEPVYLEYALSSDDFKRKILEKSSGSTVTGIRSKLLEQLTIPVPPIAQQQKFVAFVGQIEKIRLFIQKNIEKIETLKKALMQKYFE